MVTLAYTIERIRRRQQVRYWALALPLLVLALTLPMLRPLRLPDAAAISDDERVRLATIESIALRGSLSPDPKLVEGRGHLIEVTSPDGPTVLLPAQEPMLAVIGAGVFQALRLFGIRPSPDEVLGAYLLTAILCALPCAVTAVLLYRIGRLMELGRSRRMGLAMLCIAGGGLLPYATVLSPQPLAAMLVVSSLACVVHVATTSRVVKRDTDRRTGGDREAGGGGAGFVAWIAWGGFVGGLAGAVMPMAAPMAAAVGLSLAGMPWRRTTRLLGMVVFALGCLGPAAVHKLLLTPYGDVWTVQALLAEPDASATDEPEAPMELLDLGDADPGTPPSSYMTQATLRLLRVLVGPFGVLTHGPVAILACVGVGLLLIKYWPGATRWLALMTLAGVMAPLLWWAWGPPRVGERMWGPQPVVAVLPIFLLWTGVLFRPGRLAGIGTGLRLIVAGLILFSVGIGLLGMVRPFPRGGFNTYPPWALAREWTQRPAPPADTTTQPTSAASSGLPPRL